jgi:hypothetical protein
MTREQHLTQEATKLLRTSGFTWAGRPKSSVKPEQAVFERKQIPVPTNGDNRYKRK